MKKDNMEFKITYIILLTAIILEGFDVFLSRGKDSYNNLFSQGVNPSVTFTDVQDNTIKIPTEEELLAGKSNFEIFNYYVTNQKYIMHAGGAIDGHNYTNSYETLKAHYDAGNRIFEIDINMTNDNHLVLLHGWAENDYKYKLGIAYNEDHPVLDYETFKEQKLFGQYQTMGFEDLIAFMKENPYSYFILNLKGDTRDNNCYEAFKDIAELANYDGTILNRLVIWGYNPSVVRKALKVFDFELIALSYSNPGYMKKEIDSNDLFFEFVQEYNIKAILINTDSYNKDLVRYAEENKTPIFLFTLDDANIAKNYLDNGVAMVMSNKLQN